MKISQLVRHLSGRLSCLSAGFVAALLVLAAAAPAASAAEAGHHHEHQAKPATLQLNAGQKWETDAALRQAMDRIRQAMAASLPAIHANRLPAKGYGELAKTVDSEVANIVGNCKLSAQADAQLHIVVGELLAGAERMAGKAGGGKRRAGAVQVIGALDQYGRYFDDPGFAPLAH